MTNAEKPSDAILERIKKMLRMAEDKRGNENESAAAASMVQKLMDKYNLDFSDLVMKDLDDDESIQSEFAIDDFDYVPSRAPGWLTTLSVAVGQLFDCGVRLQWKPRRLGTRPYANVKFFGYKTDLQVCLWTYDFLVREINRLADAYYENLATGGGVTAQERSILVFHSSKVVKKSFRIGCSSELIRKLKLMADQKRADAAGSSASTALVVAKRAKIDEKFGEFRYQINEGDQILTSVADRGREAGAKINTHTPLAGQKTEAQLMIGHAK